jgi:hypothetical protein
MKLKLILQRKLIVALYVDLSHTKNLILTAS